MKTIVFAVILMFALAGTSFGFGSRGGDNNPRGHYNNNGQYVVTDNQNTNTNNNNGEDGAPAAPVPEPATMILLGAGLAGLYARKKLGKK